MTQAILKPVTFDEFIDWCPENPINRYELHNGAIVEKHKATGEHSEVAGFLCLKLGMEIERLRLPYFVPKECVFTTNNDTTFTKIQCNYRQAPNPDPVTYCQSQIEKWKISNGMSYLVPRNNWFKAPAFSSLIN